MLWRRYRKRKALESYRHVLGPRLRRLFGHRAHYAPKDVVATARREGLPADYLCYAIAMYCDRDAFDAYHAERGEVACSYDGMWAELSASVTHMLSDSDGCAHDVGDVGDALGDLSD